jgi:hypothetical protein
MIQLTIQQNHQRMQLEKWEHELHEREMHVMERELKLLMSTNNQERSHTPKVQKRSGHFMRSLLHAALNGNANLSSTTATHLISSPTSLFYFIKYDLFLNYFCCLDFRHLISVCRDHNLVHHPHPSLDGGSSSTIPISLVSSLSPISCPSPNTFPLDSTTTTHSQPSNSHFYTDGLYTSKSTPTTPNLSRLRTLTCTYLFN